ncbi:MAG: methylated-DNA--[protein]-cysteine S-methyltransferase [Kiritimatiellales bacterium]|nr:methylated-DNA--[protein]-cysteine S-methyltransferase [Kiritimatiellota bacterium]MBL7011620.1 methylated-DNA--[protein]-cysteine S-methyltransferase [Kiritimatiellales bacterium]
MKTVQIQTTWGPITLTLAGGKVIECALPFLKTTPRKPFKIKETPGAELINPFFAASLPSLRASLTSCPSIGKKSAPQRSCFPRFGTSEGTDFQKAVWNELQKIPRGQTRTYGEIAAAIGRPSAVRAVGSACGANPLPLFIPCHRVTAKNGLGGFGSGLPWKKLLLERENWSNGVLEV